MPVRAQPFAARSGPIRSLPQPRLDSGFSLERALCERRSTREFRDAALTLDEVGQVLWAAQDVTREDGLRTAPSAGALYPLELYLVAGNIHGLDAGVYHYRPQGHELNQIADRDRRVALAAASLGQECVAGAAVVLAFSAVERRTLRKYGSRGHQYIRLEAGHAAQNAFLQAVVLGLGAVVVGAFEEDAVQRALQLPETETPLYLISLGHPCGHPSASTGRSPTVPRPATG